jgi:hypothetical protein
VNAFAEKICLGNMPPTAIRRDRRIFNIREQEVDLYAVPRGDLQKSACRHVWQGIVASR